MKKSIVWGTCWFNENIEQVIKFYLESINSLSNIGFDVVPVIFCAKLKIKKEEITLLKTKIPNVIVLLNTTNIYPNKNFGVALIAQKAYIKHIDYVAIVDSDWSIKENLKFIKNVISKLINDNCDIIIPNIQDAAGRSNLLIGKTILELFYPNFKSIILTVFPGAVAGKTDKLYDITSQKDYHFDWGGEWDIISYAISKNLKIASATVDVENVRHRNNNSKMQDSFQIWRAVFSNPDILKRFKNLFKYSLNKNSENELIREILTKDSIEDIITIIENNQQYYTAKQILYMIIYPLGFLTQTISQIPNVKDNDIPYEKEQLIEFSKIGMYCAQQLLKNIDIKMLHKNSKTLKGKFLSEWNFQNQKEARKVVKEL